MNKLSLVFCLFVSILAPASSFASSNPLLSSSTEISKNEGISTPEILLAPVGFDKVLTLVVTGTEQTDVKVEIRDSKNRIKYASQISVKDAEVAEIDLSRLAGGSYAVKITQGEYEQIETIILP